MTPMMSKKRAREFTAPDTRLIEIYDDLANEDEEIRLKGAYALLLQFSSTDTTIEQHKTILKRLFRGLCSGRKAARLGFSVALTEFLSQVALSYVDDKKIKASEIIDLLVSQTAVDGSTSGQDERDHYFGRLFGAEAIVKSSILFSSLQDVEDWEPEQTYAQWIRLLDIVCSIASKKPWLREQCGWLLFNCVNTLSKEFNDRLFAALMDYKLLRTPEGVGIWLNQRDSRLRLQSSGFWKGGSPLSNKGVSILANIMKDAKPQQADSDGSMESQGKAMWSPHLHFAWDLVLRELYTEAKVDRISFSDFWLHVVDQSLFASSSSAERKHWGFLLLAKVFAEAPENIIRHVMTPNTVLCLQNQLRAESRYLQRSAQKAIQAMHARVTKTPAVALLALHGILLDARAFQFDVATKTKTIEKLTTFCDHRSICSFFRELFQNPGVANTSEATNARKTIADLLVAVCMWKMPTDHSFHQYKKSTEEHKDTLAYDKSPLAQSRDAIEILVEIGFFANPLATPEVSSASREYVRERIMACLEQALKEKAIGRALLRHTIASILIFEQEKLQTAVNFDDTIQGILKEARRRLDTITGSLFVGQDNGQQLQNEFESNYEESSDKDSSYNPKKTTLGKDVDETYGNGTMDGIILLYHLALLQVYGGEAEAVTIVEELNAYHDQLIEKDSSFMGGDLLVEVLLTFASKPSKFLRKISLQAFASFAVQITQDGLQSLIRVLDTKENLHGQAEMFHAAESEGKEMGDVSVAASDMDVDSDVEELSAPDEALSEESSNPQHNGGDDGSDESDESDEDSDDELAAFDAKLAAALGTRKGEDDLAASDTSGPDDNDMSDSEMEALDEKLAEVFRARNDSLATKPTRRKKDRKDAKENIVNFKNRVLDLVDMYLKHEYANPLSLHLILPLLRLARRTNTKQLANRSCSILREFNTRCKGAAKLPPLHLLHKDDETNTTLTLKLLNDIHAEASLPGSNAHAAACSSASILLVRILSHAGVSATKLWAVYAATGTRMLEDTDCHVQPAFFTDWNNWCANARKRLLMGKK